MYSKDGKKIQPGTLLAFMPGVVYSNILSNSKPAFSVVLMPNERMLCTSDLVPFPNPDGLSVSELLHRQEQVNRSRLEKLEVRFVRGEQLNCFALGAFG